MDDYDENFSPFLWALVERSVPQPIFVVGYTGIKRWLFTALPEAIQGKNFSEQTKTVTAEIRKRHEELPKSPFGRHLGYLFIRTPDEIHEYTCEGVHIGLYTKRVPHLTASLRMSIE